MIPSVIYYEKLFGNYYRLCEEVGLKVRFRPIDVFDQTIFENNLDAVKEDKTYEVNIESREQKPLGIDLPNKVIGLKFGDYCLTKNGVPSEVYIERKNLVDFIGTLTHGLERFSREIERAAAAKAYLVVLVEHSFSECFQFNKIPFFAQRLKVTPEYVFKNVRDLIQKYEHVQFLFVKDRDKAAQSVEKILAARGLAKEIDLQLAYDKKLLV